MSSKEAQRTDHRWSSVFSAQLGLSTASKRSFTLSPQILFHCWNSLRASYSHSAPKLRRHVHNCCHSFRRPAAMAIRIRLSRSRFAFWRLVVLFCLVLPATLYIFLAYVVPVSPALVPVSLLLAKHPVLIVAHPDDESLFFGPTVLALNKVGVKKELRILVLSSGRSIPWTMCRAD
jgi:hypothetical protein